ncbi:MAG: nucleotide exchange factor GrpE [Pseudomonadota bacterium]
MANQKPKVEPDVTTPEDEAQDGPSIEDLVPGLEEEIQAQEGAEPTPYDRIMELEAERDALKDKWMRAIAEAENVRRRAERDKQDAQTYGGTRLARDILSVHDNLERAMKAADDTLREQAASFIEGVELTQRELLNAFAKHKIEAVHPEAGEKFDPNRHQAMFEAPIPGAEPGTVIECMQDGFVIADRLLRPALVGVAKAAPEAPAEPEADADADADEADEKDD